MNGYEVVGGKREKDMREATHLCVVQILMFVYMYLLMQISLIVTYIYYAYYACQIQN